ncbi:MAG TPA: MinD/ParA family protein [Trebonia sp.]|jgi:MinD-like ATPase involved in chromosome partitioning or flagellar assembly|nr:MinD/ParA family protein [Trebonia sp.]
MAGNDFNSSNGGQQDDAYRNGKESAISPGSGKFPKLAPRKFDDDDDLPAADLPLAGVPLQGVPLEALPLEALPREDEPREDEPREDEPLEDVPPMEQLPVLGGTYQPPSYGPPPSYAAEPERYLGRTSLRDPYGTPRTRAAAPPLATPPRDAVPAAMGAPVRADRPPLAAAPVAAPQEMSPPRAQDADLDLALDLGPAAGPVVAETSDVLTAEWLLHGRRAQPAAGWRRTVYRATGGLVKVGESAANLRRQDLINRVRTPVTGGHHRVAVMSLKGGVGKTTVAVGLGATLATLRGDRVIAMDANPDRGTLSDKVRLETAATVRDLLNERSGISRYADVRQFTSQALSRLEILASDRDPGISIAFSADDYREVSRLLEHFYSIAITDCGTGLLHSAMSGILDFADHIVLVSSPSVDGARSASATLDWLEAHQYTGLVRSAVVVMSTIRPRSKSTVDLDRLEAHFASRCRDVVRIPYDAHLEEGSEVDLDLMSTATQDAYLALAATIADSFAVPRHARTAARPAARLS